MLITTIWIVNFFVSTTLKETSLKRFSWERERESVIDGLPNIIDEQLKWDRERKRGKREKKKRERERERQRDRHRER